MWLVRKGRLGECCSERILEIFLKAGILIISVSVPVILSNLNNMLTCQLCLNIDSLAQIKLLNKSYGN